MIVLTTTSTAQTFNIIPRNYATSFVLKITDDTTNITQEVFIQNATTSGNYLQFTNIFNPVLREGHFYDLDIYADPSVWNTNFNLWQEETRTWDAVLPQRIDIYKDKIFCTDQTINQIADQYYDLNLGQYQTDNTYNNDYIVL